ncbi:MAG: helix-turn-helix domain-containing protein [Haliscomenobacter sp.]|uniref:helix-turn-helix domain-containing protein n=1 Tax=Haliscomenobacter sp. TaxID=2717303 RepID=UPI0029BA1FE8|nr:helix-turn-helix domain-containing protein [Haliscomenobacter sp.]MDX2068165.1 helix-turn-helix domain-containing protein [Haliscomenobacter sp.]
MNILTFTLSSVSAFGVLLSIGLAMYFPKAQTQTSKFSNILLSILLLTASLRVVKPLLLVYAELPQWLDRLARTSMAVSAPLLLFYILAVLENKRDIKRLDYLHFLVPLIYLCLPFLDQPFNRTLYAFLLVQNVVYVGVSVFTIISHHQQHHTLVYHWVVLLTVSMSMIIGCYVFAFLYDGSIFFLCRSSIFAYSSLIMLLTLSILSKKFIFALPKAEKYKNSKVPSEKIEELYFRICTTVEAQQLYLDADLTLQKLAEMVGLTAREISQVINLQTQTNFSDWINGFRIEAAKRKITSREYRNQKIAAIAFDSGFNTLSSFNATFKNKTGYTPTEYRNVNTTENLN